MSAQGYDSRLFARLAALASTVSGQTLAMAGATALSFISGPIVARALGASGKGLLAAVTTTLSLLIIALGAGFPVAARRFAVQSEEMTNQFLALGVRIAVGTFPLALAAGVGFTFWSRHGSSRIVEVLTIAVLASAPLGVLKNFATGCLTSHGLIGRLTFVRAVPPVFLAIYSIALAVIGQLSLAASMLGVILAAAIELRLATRPFTVRFRDSLPLRRFASFSLKAAPGQLAETSSVRLDQALLLSVVSTAELGRYSVAASIATLPALALTALQARDFTTLASASEEDGRLLASAFIRRGLWLTVVIALSLALVAPISISILFGDEFRNLGGVIAVLLAGTCLLSISFGSAAALVALGRPGSATAGWMAGLATTLVLEFPVAHRYGIIGAAGVANFSYLVASITHLTLLRRGGVTVFGLRGTMRGASSRTKRQRPPDATSGGKGSQYTDED